MAILEEIKLQAEEMPQDGGDETTEEETEEKNTEEKSDETTEEEPVE